MILIFVVISDTEQADLTTICRQKIVSLFQFARFLYTKTEKSFFLEKAEYANLGSNVNKWVCSVQI